ncbi:MAG: hypothetical protein JXR27_03065 [Paludibacteraceae bacterium]|nr:hypothetical protein [Paludibacteraceae bacterium]
MRRLLIFCIALTLGITGLSTAQTVTVSSRIDSSTMWIGNQTRLSFEVSQQKGQIVNMPVFSDTVVGGLEIVEPLKMDTSTSKDGVMHVTQSYIVTAFEDSLMYIPSYPFVTDNDTIWSKPLSVKVIQPFIIDSTANQIDDIKQNYNAPIYWKGIYKTALIVLLIIIVLISLFFAIRYFSRKKPELIPEKPKVFIPPYLSAISKLDQIKQEKAWQTGRSKEYHTRLTDVLREYIEETFGVPCMEMTSEEVFSALLHLRYESKTAYESLQQILRLADLVKFAKWEALPDEHELSLYNAYLFVNQTKIEPPKDIEELKDEMEEHEA